MNWRGMAIPSRYRRDRKLGYLQVTPGYVRELAASGYRLRTIGDLVQFKVFKVEPTYIQELRKLGYANLPVEDLVQFKIFRITPDYIRELDELGYAGIPTKKLVELRIHGVTTEYIRALLKPASQTWYRPVDAHAHGRGATSAQQRASLKQKHGEALVNVLAQGQRRAGAWRFCSAARQCLALWCLQPRRV
jgi:hypothetical protein